MSRNPRKIEPNESAESRIVNGVKFAFGSPHVEIDSRSGEMLISLGIVGDNEVWLILPFRIALEPTYAARDDEDA